MTLSLVLLTPCLTGGVHTPWPETWPKGVTGLPSSVQTTHSQHCGGLGWGWGAVLSQWARPLCRTGLPRELTSALPQTNCKSKQISSQYTQKYSNYKSNAVTEALFLQNDSAGFQICLMSQDFYFKISSALFSLWIPQNKASALLSILFRLLMGRHYTSF